MLTLYFKNLMLAAGPNTVYVGLYTGGVPGAGGTEIDPETLWGVGEVRRPVLLAAPVDGERYPAADTPVGELIAPVSTTHVGWFDAAEGGNLLGVGDHARTYAATDTVRVPAANRVFAIVD